MRDVRSLIEGYLNGELSADETAELSRVLTDSLGARRQFWTLVRHEAVLREVVQRSARDDTPQHALGAIQPAAPQPLGSPRTRLVWRETVAWLTAAACLLVVVLFWYSRSTPTPPQDSPMIAYVEPPAAPPAVDSPGTSPVTLTIAQQREQLLASSPDVLRLQLLSNDGGAVARQPGGDIVWSSGRQMGYLRLQGLVNTDPPQRQYQLWIIGDDASYNEVINGGVFFVDRSSGELILPIQVDHFVQQPKMFVVSVEPLGGGSALIPTLLAKADAVGPRKDHSKKSTQSQWSELK
jgi:hypothetical protein